MSDNWQLSNSFSCSVSLRSSATLDFYLTSNHDYLWQLYDICPHCKKDLLQPVDGGNQRLHPYSKQSTLSAKYLVISNEKKDDVRGNLEIPLKHLLKLAPSPDKL